MAGASNDAVRAKPKIRAVGAALATLFFLSHLLSLFHFLSVKHTTCIEHGELVHLVGDAALIQAAQNEEVELLPSTRTTPPEHDSHHCGLARTDRERTTILSRVTASLAEAPARAERVIAPAQVERSGPLTYRLAPKASPPSPLG